MKKILLKAFMLLCLILWGGVSSAWAADETLTISGAASGNNAPWGTSYGDGSGNSTTSESSSIGITYKQTARMSTAIQIKANTANGFYSTTVPTNKVIKSINIVSKTNSVNLHVSTDGTSWTSADNISSTTTRNYTVNNAYKYFKVTATSSYAQITSITVTYMSDGSDKTALATPTNLSATNITDRSATLSWDAVDGASDYTVEYKTAEGNWNEVSPTPTTNSCNLSGLDYNTNYSWRVTANPTNTTTYKSSLSASDSFKTLDFIISAGTYNVLPNNVFWGKSSQDGSQSVTTNTVFGPVTEYGMTFEMNSNTSTNSYMKADHCRVYKGYTLTITAPTGYNFTAINFTGSTWDAPSASVGTMNSKKWTGCANEVIFTFSGTSYMSNIELTYVQTATITLNSLCTDGDFVYGTYSNTSNWVVPADLVVSEVCVVDGELAIYSYNEGDIVPANAGVMVAAEAGGDYTVNLTTATATASPSDGENSLVGTGDGVIASEMAQADTEFFRLTMHNGTQIGFYWGAEGGAAFDLGANKAYLAVATDNLGTGSGARTGLWFGDNEEALESIEMNAATTIYTLDGVKVNELQKGLNIVNGKKVMVK